MRSRLPSWSSRAFGVLLAGFLAPVPAVAQDAGWLEPRLDKWYAAASRSAPGQWGIAVADQNGRLLWGVEPDQPLIPASTVKLLTTGFARSVLGGDARRPTRVVGSGHVDPATGAWVGGWALELNGDPTLERGEGAGPTLFELAGQLKAAGVRRLSGPLEVRSAEGPANAVYPSSWAPHHRGRLFAPLVGPLTLNENVVWLTIRPGARPGRRARLVEESPRGISRLVTVRATTRSGRRSRLSLVPRKDGGWIVSGYIGTRSGPRRLSATARNPRAVLEAAWASALSRAGITWSRRPAGAGPVGPAPRVLAEVMSPPLDSVASEVNRRSLNLGAELLLQWAGGREQPARRLTEHVRLVTGADDEVHLVDGSGLSYDDRVAPAVFTTYLARFPTTPAGRNFPFLLPANGSGTLRKLKAGLAEIGVVRAKTGSLSNVSTVVGYLGRPDGLLLVSLMYNGSRPWVARQKQWELFRELGADGVVIPSDTFEQPEPQFGGDGGDAEAPAWWPVPEESDSAR